MKKTVTFAQISGPLLEAIEDVDWFNFTVEDVEGERRFGTYEYESPGRFGSPTEAAGEFVLCEQNLLGIVTEYDTPKAKSMFQRVTNELECSLLAPEYPTEASQQFYKTYGFNGFTTQFRDDLNTYGYDSTPKSIDPEEVAQNRAMHTSQQMSEELVDEVVTELLDDGHYVAYMDMILEEGGAKVTFSNPLRFGCIDGDEWDRETFNLIIDRALELVTNNVKTVEEVLAEP